MNKKFGKSINLFLVEGDPTSITTAELSNWNATCIKLPRHKILEYKERFQQCGVYFLFTADNEVYVGEAENVFDRLNSHLYNYEHEKVEYYFTHVVVFESEKLNKSMVRYLENKSKTEIEKHGQMEILTKATYGKTVLKESDIAECEEFFENMKIIIKVFGYNIFEPKIKPLTKEENSKKEENVIKYYYLKHTDRNNNKFEGKAYESENGFVICKGTQLAKTTLKNTSEYIKNRIINALATLKINKKIDDENILLEDFECSSSSFAASLIIGGHFNGRTCFYDENGKTLKEIQEEKINE